ncbi:hypothetical protein KR018_008156 [Drosophila ironensis]|nr:hypothetical protein KR018_008156 [Drosophila ironensis]
MASSIVWLVFILGSRWSAHLVEGIPPKNGSKLLAALNSSAPPAQEVLFHIDVWRNEGTSFGHFDVLTDDTALEALGTPSSSHLESVIRSEIGGDWERGESVLQLASKARNLELKEAIYTALWKELQQTKQIYDPVKILDFHDKLSLQTGVPPTLVESIYRAFVSRSAQILEAPFHTDSLEARFPLVDSLLHRLTFSTIDYLRDILEALYNAVLALETPLSVVERVNLTGTLMQLAQANLQLLAREEIKRGGSDVQLAVQRNLRDLVEHASFEKEVEASLRREVYAHLSKDEQLLYTAQKVCIGNVTQNSYIYECPQTYLICSNARDQKKASYFIQRGSNKYGRPQFAFYSAYWRNRYILMEPATQPGSNSSITKNVYSRGSIDWWRVVYGYGGISLIDAATETYALCGGNSSHWDSEEHHVYTRLASGIGAYRAECTWSLEDCSDAA